MKFKSLVMALAICSFFFLACKKKEQATRVQIKPQNASDRVKDNLPKPTEGPTIPIVEIQNEKVYTAKPIENSGLPEDVISRMLQIQGNELPEPVNCWGVALWSLGYITELRPSLKSEVLYSFKKNKCRVLSSKDIARSGDIGSFYNNEIGIFHTFVYLDEKRAFEKASPYKEDSPVVVILKSKFEVIKNYSAGCKSMENGKCNLGIVNYRCDLSKAVVNQESSRITLLDSLLDSIQSCDGSAPCTIETSQYFLQYTTLLKEMIDGTSVLDPLLFKGFSKLLVLIQGKKDFSSQLSLESLNSFSSVAKDIERIEHSTPNTLQGFQSIEFKKN